MLAVSVLKSSMDGKKYQDVLREDSYEDDDEEEYLEVKLQVGSIYVIIEISQEWMHVDSNSCMHTEGDASEKARSIDTFDELSVEFTGKTYHGDKL